MASHPFVKELNHNTDGDRISDLPLNVTAQILECLPLDDAVRMSILSRYWRDKWVMIPQLILDQHFFEVPLMPLKYGSSAEFGAAYSDIVNKVLLRHTDHICKFVLYLHPKVPDTADISHWIHRVSSKGVKDFTLNEHRSGIKKLPSCLFSCVTLTHLTLEECLISSLPMEFSGFPCLTSLHLRATSFLEANMLQFLISSCPQLQSLEFLSVEIRDITISAPNLRDLVVCGKVNNIHLNGTTKIRTLSLDAEWCLVKKLSNFFCCLPNLETLVLGALFWECCCCNELPKITNELGRLKTLKFVGIPVDCHWPLSFAFACCPHLQKLEIKVSEYLCNICLDTFRIGGDCSFRCLTYVALVCIWDSDDQLRLINLLLACSPVLEIMSIELFEGIKGNENMAKELMCYPRASKNAKILFKS